MRWLFLVFAIGSSVAYGQIKPVVSQRNFNDQANIVRLAPRYASAIRMPEPVSSVILGDPGKFLAEHSDKEPTLVLVKPIVDEPAESNLLVTTTNGRQVSFVLRNDGTNARQVDFLLTYKPIGTFLVEESGFGTVEVPRTETIATSSRMGASVKPVNLEGETSSRASRDPLEELLERQQRAALPVDLRPGKNRWLIG